MRFGARCGLLVAVLAMGGAAGGAGCNVVVGVGDYVVGDGGGGDAANTSDSSSGYDSSGGMDSTAGDDAGTEAAAEAASCTPVTMMPVPSQGGAGCQQDSDGSTCWPHDTTSFTSTWVQPVGAHLGVCTSTQLSDYFTACQAAAATTQSCDAWKQVPGNMACSGCVETPSNAGAYGPIISYPNVNLDQINLAGCIALVEPCNQPCSAAILAQLQCENAACTSPFCGDFASYQACAGQADMCADCNGFVSAADCQAQLTAAASQHPAVSVCNLGAASFQDFFTTIATLMCGS